MIIRELCCIKAVVWGYSFFLLPYKLIFLSKDLHRYLKYVIQPLAYSNKLFIIQNENILFVTEVLSGMYCDEPISTPTFIDMRIEFA